MATQETQSWLPQGVPHLYAPDDPWPLVHSSPDPKYGGGHWVVSRGTVAYECWNAVDGRLIELREWVDGVATRQWVREPLDGTWDFTWTRIDAPGEG